MSTKHAKTIPSSAKRGRGRKEAPRDRRSTRGDENKEALKSEERILQAVNRIPRGRVCTYGGVAHVAGLPRRARLVGTVLRTTSVKNIPWFRVINASGRISFPKGSDAYQRQRAKLEAEGVVFAGGRVDLRKYGWPETAESLDEYLWAPR